MDTAIWHSDESMAGRTPSEAWLRAVVRYATLAPSRYNAQPWRFHITPNAVELHADRARSLRATDADDRQLVLSCGAALVQLRLALRHFGHLDLVEAFPDASRPDLLARVRVGPQLPVTPAEDALFRAIPRRRTYRAPFDSRTVSDVVITALEEAVRSEGARLLVVRTSAERLVLGGLVGEAQRRQARDPEYRRELAEWLRSNHDERPDGMPGYARGHGDLASHVTPHVVRRFDWGSSAAERDRTHTLRAPVLALLHTTGDAQEDWLAAGQALGRLLLTATVVGVSAAYLNAPIEVPELRPDVARVLGITTSPQLMLRLGHASAIQPTPRRDVDDVIL